MGGMLSGLNKYTYRVKKGKFRRINYLFVLFYKYQATALFISF